MDPYQITFETWNKVAQLYQDKFMDMDLYNDTYDRFCGLVEKRGAKVLEIGCGPGNITRYLLERRSDFHIEAIDVAPKMIELARTNIPAARFEIMDCRELHIWSGLYDAIMCGFTLPYLSQEDSAKLIKDCAGLLRNEGILYLSTIEGDYNQSGYEAGSSGDKSYVYYYSGEYLQKTLKNHGFEPVEVLRKHYSKADGATSAHLIIIARKEEQ